MAIIIGAAGIAVAYVLSRKPHPDSLDSFLIALLTDAGVTFVLVGVLLRIQRAIGARLDATREALLSVQAQFTEQIAEINARISEVARQSARDPSAVPAPSPVESPAPPQEPKTLLLGEWLGARLIHLGGWIRRLAKRFASIPMVFGMFFQRTDFLGLGKLVRLARRMYRSLPKALVRASLLIAALVGVGGIVYLAVRHHSDTNASPPGNSTPATITPPTGPNYPQSSRAASYAAPSIRQSCNEVANNVGAASTVQCDDDRGNAVLFTLEPSGPWSSIYVQDESSGGEVSYSVRPGNCAHQPPAFTVYSSEFTTSQGQAQLYCLNPGPSTGNGDMEFIWYYGGSKYAAVAEVDTQDESWAQTYQAWMSDRELLLSTKVPSAIFNRS